MYFILGKHLITTAYMYVCMYACTEHRIKPLWGVQVCLELCHDLGTGGVCTLLTAIPGTGKHDNGCSCRGWLSGLLTFPVLYTMALTLSGVGTAMDG